MKRTFYPSIKILCGISVLLLGFIGCNAYIQEEPLMFYDFEKLYTFEGDISNDLIPDKGKAGAYYTFYRSWDDTLQTDLDYIGYFDESGYRSGLVLPRTYDGVDISNEFYAAEIPAYFIRFGSVSETSDTILLFKLNTDGLSEELIENKVMDPADFPSLTDFSGNRTVAVSGGRCHILLNQNGTFYEISYQVDEDGFSDPREEYSTFFSAGDISEQIDLDIPDYSLFWENNPAVVSEFYPNPDAGETLYIVTYTEMPSGIIHAYRAVYNGSDISVSGFEFAEDEELDYDFIEGEYVAYDTGIGESVPGAYSGLNLYYPDGELAGGLDLSSGHPLSMSYTSYFTEDGAVQLIFAATKNTETTMYTLPLEEVLE